MNGGDGRSALITAARAGVHRSPVKKALQVLAWMIDDSGADWGVRSIARNLGLSPATVYRALVDLEAQGLVRSDAGKSRYTLGLELFRLASRSSRHFPLAQRAVPVLQRLVDATNETAYVGVYDPQRREVMFAASVESTHELRHVIVLNKWMPLYLAASGLAILAFLPERERKAVIARRGRRLPASQLTARLQRVARDGYALTTGERVPGAVGIAAPVFGVGGAVIGDMGLGIPVSRFAEPDEPRLAKLVMQAARHLTTEAGGDWPPDSVGLTRRARS